MVYFFYYLSMHRGTYEVPVECTTLDGLLKASTENVKFNVFCAYYFIGSQSNIKSQYYAGFVRLIWGLWCVNVYLLKHVLGGEMFEYHIKLKKKNKA